MLTLEHISHVLATDLKIVYSVDPESILIIELDRDSQFGDTVMYSKGMAELSLPTSSSTKGIQVLLDVVDFNVPVQLDLDF